MFYTKYRPQQFADLVGLENIAQAILSSIRAGKQAHAYFFFGPRGTGKTSAARLLGKTLNCQKPETKSGEACGQCSSCQAVAKGSHLDIIEIDAASYRGIDDIRGLRDRVKLSPSSGQFKVYIIDEVHMLTREAFNALLKTLEEPPAHVVFVLCTTDPQKVPPTIKSRCVQFEFRRATEKAIVEKLKRIVAAEKAKIGEGDLKKMAKAAVGGFRDAETMLEQIIIGGIPISAVVHAAAEEGLARLIRLVALEKDAGGALLLVNEVFESGVDLSDWTQALLDYLRQLLLIQKEVGEELVDTTAEQYALMEEQAAKVAEADLLPMIRKFSLAQRELGDAVIPQLPLELTVVELCQGAKSASRPPDDPPAAAPLPPAETRPANHSPTPTAPGDPATATDRADNQSGPQNSGKQASPSTPPAATSALGWERLIAAVKPRNHSLEALLRSCSLGSCDGKTVTIETAYAFHKERLETVKNRRILEEIIQELIGSPVSVRLTLRPRSAETVEETAVITKPTAIPAATSQPETLTDRNLDLLNEDEIAKKAMEIFSGELT